MPLLLVRKKRTAVRLSRQPLVRKGRNEDLRENPLNFFSVNQFSKRHDVRCHTEGTVTFVDDVQQILEGLCHQLFKHIVDLFSVPGQLLDILNPLEIGDDDAAAVGVDVRDQSDAALFENVIGFFGPFAASTT